MQLVCKSLLHRSTVYKAYSSSLGLARTVYIRRIWPYIWWFPCQQYRIYTAYIWFWPTLFFFKQSTLQFEQLQTKKKNNMDQVIIMVVVTTWPAWYRVCAVFGTGYKETPQNNCGVWNVRSALISRLGHDRIYTPFIYTVYDRIFDGFPAKITVYTPYAYGSGQLYWFSLNCNTLDKNKLFKLKIISYKNILTQRCILLLICLHGSE
jgi:hypothetical protein